MIHIVDTDVDYFTISQRVIMKYSLFIFTEAVYRVLKFCQEDNQKKTLKSFTEINCKLL